MQEDRVEEQEDAIDDIRDDERHAGKAKQVIISRIRADTQNLNMLISDFVGGLVGDKGEDGERGDQGLQGNEGIEGDEGIAGDAGEGESPNRGALLA